MKYKKGLKMNSIIQFKNKLEISNSKKEIIEAIEELNPNQDLFSSMIIVSCNLLSSVALQALLETWINRYSKQFNSVRGLGTMYRSFGLKTVLPWLEAGMSIHSSDSNAPFLRLIIADGNINHLEKILPYWKTPEIISFKNNQEIIFSSGLFWAESEAMINWLVEHGANPNKPSLGDNLNKSELLPLLRSLSYSKEEQLYGLLKIGADPQQAHDWVSKTFNSKDFDFLQFSKHTHMVFKYLTEYGYDWNHHCDSRGSTHFELLQKSEVPSDIKTLIKVHVEKKKLEEMLNSAPVKPKKHL